MTGGAGPQRLRPDAPFEEPWQARAFALAVVAVERMGLPYDAFRDQLKAAVAARPDQPYFESWMDALEALVAPGGPRSSDPRADG